MAAKAFNTLHYNPEYACDLGSPTSAFARASYGPSGPEASSVLGMLDSREERELLSVDQSRLASIERRNRIRARAVGTSGADAWDAQYVADVEYLLRLAQQIAEKSARARPVSLLRRLFRPHTP